MSSTSVAGRPETGSSHASDPKRKYHDAVSGGLSSIHKHTLKGGQKLTTIIAGATRNAAGKIEGVTKKTGEAVKGLVVVKRHAPDHSDSEDAVDEASSAEKGIQEATRRVEPDELLSKMNVILRKRLGGVSVEQFHEHIWKQGDFYNGWLQASGKDEITVQDWEASEGGYRGEWKDDTTQYFERREVDFKFTRTTHLYTGPPVAKVNQIHLCKLTEDRCTVHIQIKMEGIPFANCFNVQIRWVATRTATTQVQIEVGLFVDFVEQTIMAGKIRSGTTEETTKTQQSLLNAVLEECGKYTTDAGTPMEVDDGNDETITGTVRDAGDAFVNPCLALPKLLADLFKNHRSDPLGRKVQSVERTLRGIIDSLDTVTDLDPQAEAKIDSELTDIHESLITIQRHLKMAGLRKKHGSRNLFE